MNFLLSKHHQLLQKEFSQFAQTYAAPLAAKIDAEECFPTVTMDKLIAEQLMLLSIPRCYNGRAEELLSSILLIEELAKHCAATSIIVSTQSLLVCLPILKYGSQEQKAQLFSAFSNGSLGAFALTEPQAGTDVLAIETTAEKKDDHYILNGQKKFITNAGIADIYLVFAQTAATPKKKLSVFLVPSDTVGLTVSEKVSKMGIRGSTTASLTFENCSIPQENLLGTFDHGYKIALETLNFGRIGVAAQALGIAEGAFDSTTVYVQQREQFGQPLANKQHIQFTLAELQAEIEAARLLVYQAATFPTTDDHFSEKASIAKLFASKTAMSVTTKCLQLHGGNGYLKDFPIERMMRDAKITEIYEGTSEVQKMIIAHQLFQDATDKMK